MLSSSQLSAFEEDGFVRLPAAFPQASAEAMVERVWEALGRRGIDRDGPDTWPMGTIDKLQNLKSHRIFDAIGSDAVNASLDQLLGAGRWRVPKEWGQFLITFPANGMENRGGPRRPNEWAVPHRVWHTDFSFRLREPPLFGTLVFSFLGSVPPRSGGTLVVRGSHHLLRNFVERRPTAGQEKMKFTREAFLRSDPWLRALASEEGLEDRVQRFVEQEHCIDGTPVRVTELCGDAGDVILCHPWILHTSGDNAGNAPRMMRVQRIHVVQKNPSTQAATPPRSSPPGDSADPE